jgi:hypothetical protein
VFDAKDVLSDTILDGLQQKHAKADALVKAMRQACATAEKLQLSRQREGLPWPRCDGEDDATYALWARKIVDLRQLRSDAAAVPVVEGDNK